MKACIQVNIVKRKQDNPSLLRNDLVYEHKIHEIKQSQNTLFSNRKNQTTNKRKINKCSLNFETFNASCKVILIRLLARLALSR